MLVCLFCMGSLGVVDLCSQVLMQSVKSTNIFRDLGEFPRYFTQQLGKAGVISVIHEKGGYLGGS
jgi:hypothetical protein